MSDIYMYHGNQRVRVLQTNAVTCVVQVGGMPPYNVNKTELRPDIPAIAELRKPNCSPTVETYSVVKINGKEIRDYTKDELYSIIRYEEADLIALQSIHKKPQALINEITKRNANLAHLIEQMDKVFV